jgi:subtilase family serine protease
MRIAMGVGRLSFAAALVSTASTMWACSGRTDDTSEPTATTSTSQPLVALPAAVDYRHVKGVRRVPGAAGAAPKDADCRSATGSPCYSPQEMQTAYGVSSLLADGFDGAGQTILIVDAFGSPTIAADLAQFDADYGLPNPPSFRVVAPIGSVPFDPNDGDMQGWAVETTLDVEWAHTMAPGASIVLLTSPVSETEGTQGMPELIAVETYALDHHLGKIISQSWGATENTLFDAPGRKVLADFERVYARARKEHVTVFASSGDSGSANQEVDGVTFYSFPTVGYPASSPNVTAVGGTRLLADVNGTWQSEPLWRGSGGGVSQYFGEPLWQRFLPRTEQGVLGGKRGLPDVAYNADPRAGVSIYLGIPGVPAGYYVLGGTSAGSPQWAGIAADLNQLAGRPLGFLNGKLYALGALGALKPFTHDITVGNNGTHGVTGYDAAPGWDLVSGWGTPALAGFGKLLAELPDDD